ncbi:MAG TPA: hypothetical protein VIZ68_06720, partial [Thermoplasmata archaeon]
PAVVSFVASPPAVDIGQSLTLITTRSGGTPPVHFLYTGLPPGCTTLDASNLVCSPISPGIFFITVELTDSYGWRANGSLALQVNLPVRITGFALSSAETDVGLPVSVTANASGGAVPYSFFLSGFPGSCVLGRSPSASCSPTLAGSFSLLLTARDSLNQEVTSSLSLTVYSNPSAPEFSFAPAEIDLGQSASAPVVVQGGAPPVSIRLSNLFGGALTGCSTGPGVLTCTPTSVGNLSVLLVIADAVGVGSRSVASVQVLPPLLVTELSASPSPALLGQSITVHLGLAGGLGPYNVSFFGLPSGCRTEGSFVLVCRPETTGSWIANVSVSDSLGGTTSASITLQVDPSFWGLSVVDALTLLAIPLTVLAAIAILVLRRRRRKRPSRTPLPSVENEEARGAGVGSERPS